MGYVLLTSKVIHGELSFHVYKCSISDWFCRDMKNEDSNSGTMSQQSRLNAWLESKGVQYFITAVIIINGVILGLETSDRVMERFGLLLVTLDRICLTIFIIEISMKLYALRLAFWRDGWNIFDVLVVGVALVPGSGPLAVLRSLRVLRVLRLMTVVPSLRKVVAAFLHAIPGLVSVVVVMAVFFYTTAVLATKLFGDSHPQWFGSVGASLYSLFQIMTLESWSMGIVRPVMEVHPYAWMFFVPFIMIATFTILNLFIGIIVSTMTELSMIPDMEQENQDTLALLTRIEDDLAELKRRL
jgi:voltage-gated sodium channel